MPSDMMPDKVVTINGGRFVDQEASNDGVVKFIEGILARARRGEITSVGVTWVRGNGKPAEGFSIGRDERDCFVLHCGAHCLADSLLQLINSGTYEVFSEGKDGA